MRTAVMLNTALWNSAGHSLGQEAPPGPAPAGVTAPTTPAAKRKVENKQDELKVRVSVTFFGSHLTS